MSVIQRESSSQKQLTQKDYQEFCPQSGVRLIGLGCYCSAGHRLELPFEIFLLFFSRSHGLFCAWNNPSLCALVMHVYFFLFLIFPHHLVLSISSRSNPEGFTFHLSAHEMKRVRECIVGPCFALFNSLSDVWHRWSMTCDTGLRMKSGRACSFWFSYTIRIEQF